VFVVGLSALAALGCILLAMRYVTKPGTLLAIIILTWLYLLIPIPVLLHEIGCTALEAMYWGFQSLGSVGFGDMKLESDVLRLFAACYCGLGMCLIFTLKKTFFDFAVEGGKHNLKKSLSVLLIVVGAFTIYWGYRFEELGHPGNRFVNGFYFSLTTIATIGFGDLTPVGPLDCIIFGVHVIVGIPLWFFCLGNLSDLFSVSLKSNIDYNDRMHTVTAGIITRFSLKIHESLTASEWAHRTSTAISNASQRLSHFSHPGREARAAGQIGQDSNGEMVSTPSVIGDDFFSDSIACKETDAEALHSEVETQALSVKLSALHMQAIQSGSSRESVDSALEDALVALIFAKQSVQTNGVSTSSQKALSAGPASQPTCSYTDPTQNAHSEPPGRAISSRFFL